MASKNVDGKTIILGLQHTFVMFGATVLVPILTGLDIGVTLFAAGIGTLLFHVVTKFKVPVFLGSSFAFIPGLVAVGASEGLPYALGGIFVAGLLYIVVAIIITSLLNMRTCIKILPHMSPAHDYSDRAYPSSGCYSKCQWNEFTRYWLKQSVRMGAGLLLDYICNRHFCEDRIP